MVPVRLISQKILGSLVPADLHLLQLHVLPLVHGDGPDEGEVDPQPPVFARALQTYPDTIGDTHPLWVVAAALETFLETNYDV